MIDTDTMMRTIVPGERYACEVSYRQHVGVNRNADRPTPFTVTWYDEWRILQNKDYKTPHGAWARIQTLIPADAQWRRTWPEDRA